MAQTCSMKHGLCIKAWGDDFLSIGRQWGYKGLCYKSALSKSIRATAHVAAVITEWP